MTQMDFIISIAIIITIVSVVLFYTTSMFTTEFNEFKINELHASADCLEKQLFETETTYTTGGIIIKPILKPISLIVEETDPYIIEETEQIKQTNLIKPIQPIETIDVSLKSDVSLIKVMIEEIGNYSHTEKIVIVINGDANKAYLNDFQMNNIKATFARPSLYFDFGFLPLEKKYLNIYYYGNPTSISSLVDEFEQNITVEIMESDDVKIVTGDNCAILNGLKYETLKNMFGIKDDFKLKTKICEIGIEPPETNVISKTKPILVETDKIEVDIAKVLIW